MFLEGKFKEFTELTLTELTLSMTFQNAFLSRKE